MPRYYLPEEIECVARFQSRVPFTVSGVDVASLTFPVALVATGQKYANRTQLVAGVNDALPDGVSAALHQDGKSVVITHESTYTPPDDFPLWPSVNVYVTTQSGVHLCPFVGPVTGPVGGEFGTLQALLTAVDEADSKAYYQTTTAEDCRVLVLYDPTRATPGNIVVTPGALSTRIKIVEQGTTGQVPCPIEWPIFLTDGTEVLSLTALAAIVQADLGLSYGVQPHPDGCSLLASYSRETTPPAATLEVRATRSKIIPALLNGQIVCPPPFPVALASNPNGQQYATMAELVAAFKATLPAGWDADPTNVCQVQLRYPMSATTVPLGVEVVTLGAQASVVDATFGTVRSKQSDLAPDFTSNMPAGNSHYGDDLLSRTTKWPRKGVFNYAGSYAATAYLYGLRQSNGQAPDSRVYKLRVTVVPSSQTYVALRTGPNSTDAYLNPSSRGGGAAATRPGYPAAVTDVPASSTTIEWDIPEGTNPANLCLIVQMPGNDQQLILSKIEFDTSGTGSGGSGSGGVTTPNISTIAAQSIGVGSQLAVTFTVANSPATVTSSVGAVQKLDGSSYRWTYTPSGAGTTTVEITATNSYGYAKRSFTVTAGGTGGGGGGGTTTPPSTSVKQQLKDDMGKPHEGNLDGVPDFYDWAHSPRVGMGNDGAASSGFNAATAWGEVYSSYGGSNDPAPNTNVQIANLGLAVLSKAGTWTVIQRTLTEGDRGIDAGYFTSDFQGNITSPESPPQLADGTRAGHPNIKYNFHFFPQGRVPINNNDIAGVVAWFDARLVLRDSNGTDDRGNARYLAGAGGDYWLDLSAPWPNNGDFAIGRHRFVKNDWQTFTAHTLTDAQIDANPPPIPNFKIAGTGGTGGGGPVTPPVTGSWVTPTGRAIKILPVGDSITGFMGESSAGYVTLPARVGPTYQVVTVGSQTGYGGTKHEGHGAWCADDTGGRCTHTNGYHAGGIIQNIQSWTATYQPDVIILNIGTNDRFVQAPYTDAQIAQAVGTIIDLVRQTRPSTWVMVTGLRYLDEVGGYGTNTSLNNQLQSVVGQKLSAGAFVSYIEEYRYINTACDFNNCNDYVHPSDQGVAKMMQAVEESLEYLFSSHAG